MDPNSSLGTPWGRTPPPSEISSPKRVVINVGGQRTFETYEETLLSKPDTLLADLMNGFATTNDGKVAPWIQVSTAGGGGGSGKAPPSPLGGPSLTPPGKHAGATVAEPEEMQLPPAPVPHQVLQKRLGGQHTLVKRNSTASITRQVGAPNEIFIDTSPELFAPILDYYRTGVLVAPVGISRMRFRQELERFGLQSIPLADPPDTRWVNETSGVMGGHGGVSQPTTGLRPENDLAFRMVPLLVRALKAGIAEISFTVALPNHSPGPTHAADTLLRASSPSPPLATASIQSASSSAASLTATTAASSTATPSSALQSTWGHMNDLATIPQYALRTVNGTYEDRALFHDLASAFSRELRVTLEPAEFLKRLETAIAKAWVSMVLYDSEVTGIAAHPTVGGGSAASAHPAALLTPAPQNQGFFAPPPQQKNLVKVLKTMVTKVPSPESVTTATAAMEGLNLKNVKPQDKIGQPHVVQGWKIHLLLKREWKD
ncbi:hypothetical protein BJ742DRAFT_804175 [Cladochytrium replicatum]|nr:hypothetical protein BJ742DRAFT_804175 [Cladochytrium replicatum]